MSNMKRCIIVYFSNLWSNILHNIPHEQFLNFAYVEHDILKSIYVIK